MPSLVDPISRPSSTSTVNSSLHHSASLPQLPGLSALASLASSSNSPQMRYVWNFQFRGTVLAFDSGRELVGGRRIWLHIVHGYQVVHQISQSLVYSMDLFQDITDVGKHAQA